jgi:hypothetical protein
MRIVLLIVAVLIGIQLFGFAIGMLGLLVKFAIVGGIVYLVVKAVNNKKLGS